MFGVFPLLTPLKKALCFPISLTIGTNFPPISPNFPQCFPANCALLSHQFPPTFLSISIRLPPNFPPQFPPNVLTNSLTPASFQASPPMSFVSDTWPTVRQFHDAPLNKVFALATCHDPCDAPAGPCDESSIPAPSVLWKILSCSHPCVLSRPVRCPYGTL